MGLKESPKLLLLFLSSINLLLYVDRGVIGSNGVNGSVASAEGPGTGIQGDFKVSNAVDGFLPGAFMVGLLVSSPLFAECSKSFNAFRLLAVGLGVWVLACLACAFAPSFAALVVFRMFVGVGEASFVALAAPFIDDSAPPESKTKWLAAFYLCIPTGYALGYILGGILAVPLSWRGPFIIEAVIMVPFALFCCFAPAIDIRGTKEGTELGGEHFEGLHPKTERRGVIRQLFADICICLSHPVFVFNLLGSTVYTGVIGAYAYLGPKAGKQVFDIPGESADIIFGAVTVLTGIFGTLLGGVVMDWLGSGVRVALSVCWVCTLAGCVLVVASFALATALPVFVAAFAFGELFLFAIQAPQNAVALWSVPPHVRPFAMSITIVVTHILGDVPSPAALGWLQDRVTNWRLSMSVCTAFLVLSSALYALARLLAQSRPDYRQTGAEPQPGAEEVSAPLLAAASGGEQIAE